MQSAEKRIRSWLELSPVCTKILDRHFHLQYMSSAGRKALKIKDITKFYGQKFPFDCYPNLPAALLDMLMAPGMNGYQTYRKIVSHRPARKR